MDTTSSPDTSLAEEESGKEANEVKSEDIIIPQESFINLANEYEEDSTEALKRFGELVIKLGLHKETLEYKKAFVAKASIESKIDIDELIVCIDEAFQNLPEKVMTDAELLAECEDIAKNPIASLERALNDLGLIGEMPNAVGAYLVATGSYLPKPMCAVLKGSSSSGKSTTINIPLKLMPDSVVFNCSSMSAKALIYKGDDFFKHKLIYLAEGESLVSKKGQKNEVAEMLRVLISEGELKHTVAEKGDTDTGHTSNDYVCKGPIGFLTTTTSKHLESEIETRLLSLYADESSTQSRRVISSIADRAANPQEELVDIEKWHYFAEWVRRGTNIVAIPYLRKIADTMPTDATRVRRDISSLKSMIEASALMNRYNRKLNSKGHIVAEPEDYKFAFIVIGASIEEGISDKLPKTISTRLTALLTLFGSNTSIHSSYSAISKKCSKEFGSNKPCKAKLLDLQDMGLINIVKNNNGIDITLGDDTRDLLASKSTLITYEELTAIVNK